MREKYIHLPTKPTLEDLIQWARAVTRSRLFDLDDYEVQEQFNPVIYDQPSSSTDLVGTEKVGDLAVGTVSGTEYLYVVTDDSGTIKWQRVALSTF